MELSLIIKSPLPCIRMRGSGGHAMIWVRDEESRYSLRDEGGMVYAAVLVPGREFTTEALKAHPCNKISPLARAPVEPDKQAPVRVVVRETQNLLEACVSVGPSAQAR